MWDKVPILIVNGDPNDEPFKGETDFLEIALQPFRTGGARGMEDLLETRVVKAAEFSTKSIGEARVVLMANVSHLKLGQLDDLQTYVKDGGGLLIFGGDKIDSKWYNEQLLPYGLLPTRLGKVEDKQKDPEPFTRVVVKPVSYTHLTLPTKRIV